MAVRGGIGHIVSAMRTALVGRPTTRFDALSAIGPAPRPGSIIEAVERNGRRVDVRWDDGIVLSTDLRFTGQWHVYRSHEAWRRHTYEARAIIEVDGWVAVCFNAPVLETFRVPDRARHPHSGGVGPDLSQRRPNLVDITRRLLSYKVGEASICDVLADQSVVTGLGNADRSETLWAVGLSPFAPVAELSYEDCAVLVEAAARIVKSRTRDDGGYEHAVYARNGQRCTRCRGTIAHGHCDERSRPLFWCPDCQQKLDRRLIPAQLVADDHTPTHPAEVLYMADVRAARKRLKIVDDLTQFG
ncbi:MAG: hypothetical protein EBY07_09510 [Actinobacteria bacterium]|nr:hypothetical protein [Actinomycetota bacterium]